ncbi:unnamed protein product [Trifolium pratense]|uniref:Uncharacterized protein n=1 Tax=Trifolium pratense TaxID=57577 RepID=A0ACB0J392_TRIPR|nr:unnamed protein product [Trifolium pratense]
MVLINVPQIMNVEKCTVSDLLYRGVSILNVNVFYYWSRLWPHMIQHLISDPTECMNVIHTRIFHDLSFSYGVGIQ